MPVSLQFPRVSLHTAPTSPIVSDSAAHSMHVSGNTLLATDARKANPSDKNNLIFAYAASIGALGIAIGLHFRGVAKSKALKEQLLPAKKGGLEFHLPSSQSKLLEYVLGCGGGGLVGYFSGKKVRISGLNKRFKALTADALELQNKNETLEKLLTADIRTQVKIGRTGILEALEAWADDGQAIEYATFMDKLTSLRNES